MSIYGYFTEAHQTKPAFDPGFSVPCPSCGIELAASDAHTPTPSLDDLRRLLVCISLMLPGDNRSYFYRAHKAYYDSLSETQQSALDGLLIDAIAAAKNLN